MNKLYIILLYMLVVLPIWANVCDDTFGVYELSCEQKIDPVGIDTAKPRFSWKISSQQRGFIQSAYHIIVSDSKEKLSKDEGNVWNSGKCLSDKSILVSYNGKELKSSTKYYWKVKVWRKGGNKSSEWSKSGTFVTGILSTDDWGKAKWIALEKDDDSKALFPGIHAPLVQNEIGDRMVGNYKLPIARKDISLRKELESAVVNISGLGHFDFFINGEKVENHFLDAGWTNYAKTALYVTFDVTDYLKKDNTLSVMLGNGFYNIPRERYFKQLISFGAPKVKMCMHLKYKDGSTEEVVTDKTWRMDESAITYSSIYGGEDYDARKEQIGWKYVGFDDNNWKRPIISDLDINLRAQMSEPLFVRDTLLCVKKYKNSKGNWIFDFGQNFSGIVRINVKGKSGKQFLLRPGELLSNDSTINQSASGGPYYWSYISREKDNEAWQPQFTYYGFRYVEVVGIDDVERFDICGLHTTNSAPEVGHFICSLPLFNKTYNLIDWSMRSNMASILTDCPHREKLGWLEVAHLMQYSLQYRYSLPGFYHQIMQNIKDSQTNDGMVPSIAPEYVRFSDGFENSPEWGSASIIIPWYVYKCYGDDSLLKEYYPQMKKYLRYLSSRAKNHIIEYGLGDWFDLGPKNPGYSQLTSNGVTATGIYYYDIVIMKQVAELLSKNKDVEEFSLLADSVRVAYNDKYYNKENGTYDRNSQTANAMSLFMGLVDKDEYKRVYENLIKDIKECGYALTSGDIGYRYLLKVLEENGDADIIYKMNTRYDVPGYGWQLAYGATALTESWQAYGFVSNNHCMLGHLMEWLFCGLGGIGQDSSSVAYKQVVVKPQMPQGIKYVNTSFESPYGNILSSWERKKNNTIVNIEIPANTRGIVYLPYSKKVYESGIEINKVRNCKIMEINDEYIKVQVSSGKYYFDLLN